MNDHHKILQFLSILRESHSAMPDIFLGGSCFNLFLLLRVHWPTAEAFYNVDHIITKIDGRFYDITGEVRQTEGYAPFTDYYNKKRTSRAFVQMVYGENQNVIVKG